MKIYVCSRRMVEQGLVRPGVPYVLLSISTSGATAPKLPADGDRLLAAYFNFYDLSPEPGEADYYPGFRMMEPMDARHIAFLARASDSLGALMIHCDAGASRSLSVAMAIADGMKWGRQVIDNCGLCGNIHGDAPNPHVYRTMLAAFTEIQ